MLLLLSAIPTDAWITSILPALGLRALGMYRCTCKHGKNLPPWITVAAVKLLLPQITNWPDSDVSLFKAMARRFLNAQLPCSAAEVARSFLGVEITLRGQRRAMRRWEAIELSITKVFSFNLKRSKPFVELMGSRAGRRLAIAVLNDEIRNNRFFRDQPDLAQIVVDMVQNNWSASLNDKNELVIGVQE